MSEKLVAVAIHDAQVCTTRTVKFEFRRIVHREHGPMLAGPFNGRRHVRCQNCFWRYLFVAEESVKTLELCFCCQDLRATLCRLRRQAAHDSPCAKVQPIVPKSTADTSSTTSSTRFAESSMPPLDHAGPSDSSRL